MPSGYLSAAAALRGWTTVGHFDPLLHRFADLREPRRLSPQAFQSDNLFGPGHVTDQVRQQDAGSVSRVSDAPLKHRAHAPGPEAEDVFHPHPFP